MKPKRYTFAEVAKRECAECTTRITTTLQTRYITEADHDADRAELVAALREANGLLKEATDDPRVLIRDANIGSMNRESSWWWRIRQHLKEKASVTPPLPSSSG